MILSFRTDKSGQTVQTQEQTAPRGNSADPDQSDQGLYCLPLCLHLRDTLHKGKATLFNF